jgi:LPXTG-site transpeptidase (sortase) family protein
LRRALLLLLGGLGALVALLGLLWFGYNLYVELVVTANPSTQPIVRSGDAEFKLGVYSGGDQVLPGDEGPTAEPTTTGPPPDSEAQAPSITPLAATTTSTPAYEDPPTPSVNRVATPSRPILPPTRLTISKIGVNAPIVLADNDNLPRFKATGWLLGTGYPGFRGNVVLFGHLNGIYETFARLHELTAGDDVIVEAVDRVYRYRAAESKVVPAGDVSVLAPTGDYRLTLITCTGTFYPRTRSYSHRIIVTAYLVTS